MTSSLEQVIARAFADVPPPPEDRLRASVGDEAEEDTEPFRRKDWKEIGDDLLARHHYALFWFTPEAFHYFFPAFLTGGLRVPSAVHVITLLQMLRPGNDPSSARFRKDRWRRLTKPQVEALAMWLRWLRSQAPKGGVFEEEVDGALDVVAKRYWW